MPSPPGNIPALARKPAGGLIISHLPEVFLQMVEVRSKVGGEMCGMPSDTFS